MIGIKAYGGYIPRLRIDRMIIYRNMGWYAPATITAARGERSFCNWDEDSITMAVEASRDCLGENRQGIGSVLLATTTSPFADRSMSVVLKEALGLPDETYCAQIGSSQRAGTQALLDGLARVAAGGGDCLVAASDRRLARPGAHYEMLYGDGAAALCLGTEDVIAEFVDSYSISADFVDHYRGEFKPTDYTWEERWVRDAGYAKIIPRAVKGLLEKAGIGAGEVDLFVYPCIFQAEHRKLAKRLGTTPEKAAPNLQEQVGECGCAHPLLMLANALESAKAGQHVVVVGFGQGADALLFRTTELVEKFRPQVGVSGYVERKKNVEDYTKFLLFRGMLEPDRGIRAEAPNQTALTVLWRERHMLHGLVGGRCEKCGTVQFPMMDVCVNPECRAHHTQKPEPFADKPAKVKTFTGDFLSYTVDPPAIYGMVQFEGGGRFMADFTDAELDGVRVGMPVRMMFRRRYRDKERGFTGYFWKAAPWAGEGAEVRIRFDDRVVVVTGGAGGLGRSYCLEFA
ncbi:MAG: hydroxymethylglutaryl-CoA synthase family protein, partial [Deltaproteobacteria bacterium]